MKAEELQNRVLHKERVCQRNESLCRCEAVNGASLLLHTNN